VNDDVTVGGAFEIINCGSAWVDKKGGPFRDDLKGEYGTNYITVFNLNIVWKF
jgi:long-chain fatty acid transport protein